MELKPQERPSANKGWEPVDKQSSTSPSDRTIQGCSPHSLPEVPVGPRSAIGFTHSLHSPCYASWNQLPSKPLHSNTCLRIHLWGYPKEDSREVQRVKFLDGDATVKKLSWAPLLNTKSICLQLSLGVGTEWDEANEEEMSVHSKWLSRFHLIFVLVQEVDQQARFMPTLQEMETRWTEWLALQWQVARWFCSSWPVFSVSLPLSVTRSPHTGLHPSGPSTSGFQLGSAKRRHRQ